jgi:hypothetical protein
MDISVIQKMKIEIPLFHFVVLSLLCSLVALIGKTKFALIFLYGAVIYWVFILNKVKFDYLPDGDLLHTGLFILTCIIFVACAAWVIFIER